jgi:outer membrane assembly lipoprotein YfiO
MRRSVWFFILLASLLTVSFSFALPPAAELRNGRWEPVAQPSTQPLPDPDLDRVEQLLLVGRNSEARKLDLYWIKNHSKTAPQRDRAVFLMAQACYQLDDHIRAYYFLDEVMDEYPESKLFFPALEMQYRIADEYLKGHKDPLFGWPWLPIVGRTDEAIEMLYRIQQRSPGSPLAEKALLRSADFYYSDAQYDLAHDAYGAYVKGYPRSPQVPQVKLRQAFSSLAQFRGIRFDPTNLLDARSELLEIQTAYPELAQDENIADVIHKIDDTLAGKLYVTGDYYSRTHDPRGAVYTFRYLIDLYPTSPKVPDAKKALAQMPLSALNQPEPQPDAQYMPPMASEREKVEP